VFEICAHDNTSWILSLSQPSSPFLFPTPKDAEFPGSTKQPNTQNHVSSVNTHWADPNEKQCQMVCDQLGQLGNPANQSVDPHPTRRIPRPRSSVQQRSHVRHRSAALAHGCLRLLFPGSPLMDVAQIWPVYHAATRQPRASSAMAGSVPRLEFNTLIKSRCLPLPPPAAVAP
jgi:hypothetical protein